MGTILCKYQPERIHMDLFRSIVKVFEHFASHFAVFLAVLPPCPTSPCPHSQYLPKRQRPLRYSYNAEVVWRQCLRDAEAVALWRNDIVSQAQRIDMK